jgi:hypothetical protein
LKWSDVETYIRIGEDERNMAELLKRGLEEEYLPVRPAFDFACP